MKKIKKILVAGGYGYTNLGDEAQCETTLELLTKRYPQYQIVNLTPNVDHSWNLHPKFHHETASRVALYNQFENFDIFSFSKKPKYLWRIPAFIIKSIWVLINAYLIKYNLPTFLLNARSVKFLSLLNESSLFYFCGGGYLTGKTLSRLWDGIVLCRLCKIFNTPVVMSGQTIGIWNNKFNELLAKWGFASVKIITVRDEEYSLKDLERIGLKGKNYFATHDDALFCKKSDKREINSNNYVTLNFHYWGIVKKQRKSYLSKINQIVNEILKQNYDIVLIPMTETDVDSFNDYLSEYSNDKIIQYEYNIDFKKIRKVIADSQICFTMKHHPIIFAMGENVPTISLAYSQYYIHKNVGALAQYGQENFSLSLEKDDYLDTFKSLFENINTNRDKIIENIKTSKEKLIQRKEEFLSLLDEILEDKNK